MFPHENLVLFYNRNSSDVFIGHIISQRCCWCQLNGAMMYPRNKFATLENMCRERAALAEKEMEYWLSEAEEWKQLRETSDPSRLKFPVQLDMCAALALNVKGPTKEKL